ncbi:hypothetical protein ACFQX6_41895 [Streptosporangium lutulentum]
MSSGEPPVPTEQPTFETDEPTFPSDEPTEPDPFETDDGGNGGQIFDNPAPGDGN